MRPTHRRILVIALSLVLFGVLALVGIGWWVTHADRPVAWERAEIAADGRTVDVWYAPPCGSEYVKSEVEQTQDAVQVTIYVEGFAPACAAVYLEEKVVVEVPRGPVDAGTRVVDGS